MTGKAKILVIDDDQTILETLVAALESEGYYVDTAKNGEEAIAKSHSHVYNVAILDWRLPDTQGTKLLSELKERTPKMAKIMLTGYPSMENAMEAVNRRADAFLLKPVSINVLLEKIEELLKLQEEANHYSEAKVVEFIETRTKQVLEAKYTEKDRSC